MGFLDELFGASAVPADPTLTARLSRVEQKLDLIIAHLGIEVPGPAPDGMDDIRALALDPSSKIMAIKLYRERTGVGLAEAKAAVEAMEAGTL